MCSHIFMKLYARPKDICSEASFDFLWTIILFMYSTNLALVGKKRSKLREAELG